VERLAGETEEEILEAAEALAEGIDAEVERRVEQRLEQRVAERLAELEQERKQQSSARGGWPVESLRPGAMPANEDTDPNEAFRYFLMGGRGYLPLFLFVEQRRLLARGPGPLHAVERSAPCRTMS